MKLHRLAFRLAVPGLAARVPPARSRARRARAAVLAGLAAFAALELGLGLASELYVRIRDPFYGDKLVKLHAKLQARPSRPCVVMLGTSRTGFAFHGTRIEDRLRAAGRDAAAFNYGVPASGPVTHLLYLRRLLADGVTPDLLLVEVLPSMLADRPSGPLEGLWVFGDRLTYSELETVERFGFPSEVRSQWRAATFHPWYALRFQLLSRVVQSWVPWHLRFDWSRGSDGSGWGTFPRDAVTPAEQAAGHARAHHEYAPVLSDLTPGGPAGAALKELLAVCRERGIPAKLVLMPESTTFRGWYPPAVRERLDVFLRGVCAEYGCELIDARGWLADGAFTDGHHLLRPGAEAFSDRLADDVLTPWLEARRRGP
jgi:hypothetical protein